MRQEGSQRSPLQHQNSRYHDAKIKSLSNFNVKILQETIKYFGMKDEGLNEDGIMF